MNHTRRAVFGRRRYAMMPRSAAPLDFFGDAMTVFPAARRRVVPVMLMCVAMLASCLVLYRSVESLHFLSQPLAALSASRRMFAFGDEDLVDFPLDSEEHRLEQVLKDAAMNDNTVILTTLNDAWAAPGSFFSLFLESFRVGNGTRGLLNHLVIIALDQRAYQMCLFLHGRCFALVTEGVDFSHEAYFMTSDYLKMMWRRINFLQTVLEMGYNFVFTDADVMWFRNPFPHFHKDVDFQIACDHFTGNPDDLSNIPNGGFNYVKSSNQSIEFYKFWYASREVHPGRHDQDVLNMIKADPFILDIGLKMKFLSTAYFGGLCEPSRDLNLVCTMHVNCCVGLDSKINDLRVMLEDWKRYMSLSLEDKKLSYSTWRVPQNCRFVSIFLHI
uniref:Glycosyltransferase n=1 Tax=Kalanchoe fedtschenkoi TaxID=63787 RepID=A0A7N0TGC6_KALFE